MNKLFILISLEFLCLHNGITQYSWQRFESSSQLDVGDVGISLENEYFISLKNNHNVFHSKDSGATWQEVEINNGKNKFYHNIDKPYLKVIDNKVYCVSCAGSSKRYLYNGEIFELLPNFTNTPSGNLKLNQNGQGFNVDEIYITRTDSNWNRIFNTFIFHSPDPYGILSSNFYTEDNNYVIITNWNDSLHTYKFTTDQNEAVLIYSKIRVSRSMLFALTSKGGTIYYMEINGVNRDFNYVSISELNKIQKSKLQSIYKVNVIYYYYINSKAEIYLVTDKGLFMNNGINEDQWIKCYQMSDQLPLPPGFFTVDYYKKYFIKDSMNALISYGDNCGQSDYYCFTPKFKKWKNIKLDHHIDNLTNLVKNKENRLFAYRPCEIYFGRNYLKSDNQGRDWELILINGEYVTSIGINKKGEALAITGNNKMYLHNSTTDNWEEIQSPVDPNGSIKLFHIYSSKNELFLSGNTNRGRSNEKNYLYHSSDGGLSWIEIKAFVQQSYHPLNDFIILEENNGNWIAYSDQGRWNPEGVLISKDRGNKWDIDIRFKDFSPVSLVQLLDNKFILSGVGITSNRGTFLIDSLGNYSIYSPYYKNNPANLFLDQDKKVFGYTAYSYTDIPFFSTDLGLNVVQDESGLLPTDKEHRLIQSAVYESGNNITLNLAYDGIYTTAHDIFSNITDDSNLSEQYSVFQNNDWITIKKNDQSAWSNHEKLQVYNLLGQTILSYNLESLDGRINTKQFVQGIYLLQLKNGNNKSQVVKFEVK